MLTIIYSLVVKFLIKDEDYYLFVLVWMLFDFVLIAMFIDLVLK